MLRYPNTGPCSRSKWDEQLHMKHMNGCQVNLGAPRVTRNQIPPLRRHSGEAESGFAFTLSYTLVFRMVRAMV